MVNYSDNCDIYELHDEICNMPFNQARLEKALKAVCIAEDLKNEDMIYHCKCLVGYTSIFTRDYEHLFDSFLWCLDFFNEYHENFDRDDASQFLWLYKYVLDSVHEYVHLDRHKIITLLDVYSSQLKKFDFSQRTYWYYRSIIYVGLGWTKELGGTLAKWKEYSRDEMSDCEACEVSNMVSMLCRLNEFEKAVDEASPVIVGKLSCEEEPQRIMSELLFPLLELNRVQEMHKYQKECLLLLESNRVLPLYLSYHIDVLSQLGDLETALKLLKEHINELTGEKGSWSKFHIYLHLYKCMDKLIEKETLNIEMKISDSVGFYQSNGVYETETIKSYLFQNLIEMASKLDKRSENNYFKTKLNHIAFEA